MTKHERIKRARDAGKASAGVPRGESARVNGRRGGRPTNEAIREYMAAHNCSRSTAYLATAASIPAASVKRKYRVASSFLIRVRERGTPSENNFLKRHIAEGTGLMGKNMAHGCRKCNLHRSA
jgi:hypothetical protein